MEEAGAPRAAGTKWTRLALAPLAEDGAMTRKKDARRGM
jgi:hypothetical protein